MNSSPDTREVLCCPTALLPIGLSLGSILIVLMHMGFYGAASGQGGDPTAHVWQILMLAQIPALALFAGRWLRIARRQTFHILALHGATIVLSVAVAALPRVYFFHL